MTELALNPNLKTVRYKCTHCMHVSAYQFAKSYVPFREWWARCYGCGGRHLLQALGRVVTGKFRGSLSHG